MNIEHEKETVMDIDKNYSVDVGQYASQSWHNIMPKFQDANLCQTLPYDLVRHGRKGVAHMILKKRNTVAAAAQFRSYRLSVLNTGLAYVLWER